MKRVGVFLMVALALVAMAAADVAAQPKVTITGLVVAVLSRRRDIADTVERLRRCGIDVQGVARFAGRGDCERNVLRPGAEGEAEKRNKERAGHR